MKASLIFQAGGVFIMAVNRGRLRILGSDMRKNKPDEKELQIKDRTLKKQGFDRFASSSKGANGSCISFRYPSGAKYKVPLEFVLAWFEDTSDKKVEEFLHGPIVLRTRTFSGGHLARVYLSNGKQHDIAWDTVLMACEPRYEHYGGLTEQSRDLTREWSGRYGSFLVGLESSI
jgi:hypothetical protein